MDQKVRNYLSKIGAAGGRKSRRMLSAEQARAMVRLREARRAFRRFHTQCFWSSREDYQVPLERVAWVAARLREHGGPEGREIARRLCR